MPDVVYQGRSHVKKPRLTSFSKNSDYVAHYNQIMAVASLRTADRELIIENNRSTVYHSPLPTAENEREPRLTLSWLTLLPIATERIDTARIYIICRSMIDEGIYFAITSERVNKH